MSSYYYSLVLALTRNYPRQVYYPKHVNFRHVFLRNNCNVYVWENMASYRSNFVHFHYDISPRKMEFFLRIVNLQGYCKAFIDWVLGNMRFVVGLLD